MADGRHFEKNVKSSYRRNRFTDFDEFWHSDAYCPSIGNRPLKFQIFKNQDGGGHHLEEKTTKIAI